MRSFEAELVAYAAVRSIPAKSVLVLAPHPDDEVLACGGAILRHLEVGAPVRVVVVTDGALGHSGEARRRQAVRRSAEAREAAQVLGYGVPEFWDLPDQGVRCSEELIAKIATTIGEADLVYAPSPYEIHPDHRAVSLAAVEAVRRHGRARLALYEVGAPLRPNLLLDISDLAPRKQAALACFRSQLAAQPYDRQIQALNTYRTYTLGPEVSAAEAFRLLVDEDLADGGVALYQSECEAQHKAARRLVEAPAPLVSVIVRSVDRPTLSDALNSVFEQTYPHIEVVLVDAGGGTSKEASACGVTRVQRVSTGARLGRSAAANAGLAAACGDYLLFLDDDDLLLPSHVEGLVETLVDTPGVRAAYAGVRVVDANGVVDTYDAPVDSARLKAANQLPINSVLFHRSLVEEGCRFDETLELYEDWDFWLQVSERTEFARRAGVSALYRVHLGSSGLYGAGAEILQDTWRRRVLDKWSSRWGPGAVVSLADRLQAIDQARAAAEATVAGLRQLLDEARREAAQRTLDLSEAMQQAGALQLIVQEMRRSRSWRMTAPVRWITGSARRVWDGSNG